MKLKNVIYILVGLVGAVLTPVALVIALQREIYQHLIKDSGDASSALVGSWAAASSLEFLGILAGFLMMYLKARNDKRWVTPAVVLGLYCLFGLLTLGLTTVGFMPIVGVAFYILNGLLHDVLSTEMKHDELSAEDRLSEALRLEREEERAYERQTATDERVHQANLAKIAAKENVAIEKLKVSGVAGRATAEGLQVAAETMKVVPETLQLSPETLQVAFHPSNLQGLQLQVYETLSANPKLSNVAVAKLLNVTHTTIGNHKRKLFDLGGGEWPVADSGRNGVSA